MIVLDLVRSRLFYLSRANGIPGPLLGTDI